jgi:hypothetical protein
VIAKRSAKKQQMQWTPRFAELDAQSLLLQLQTRVLNGTLETDLKRWHEEKRSGQHEMEIAA